MTHYDVDYTGLTPQAKHEKALADIKEYLGADRYADITDMYRQIPERELEMFALMVSFAGVQGYPVRAWHAEIWPYG